ncbi:MAG: HDOD domain-containing protein [Deltaproteobacteria bacterium]|nr:HDOD domain-containing protein [Deltaproteobacteria bacterium]
MPSGSYAVSERKKGILEALLGTCVGVSLCDTQANVAGLIHLLLPEPTGLDVFDRPEIYASTGLPLFIRALCEAGASKKRLEAHVAGGALVGPVHQRDLLLDIGGRTHETVEKILRREGIPINRSETGGFFSCCLSLNLHTFETEVEPVGRPPVHLAVSDFKKPTAKQLTRMIESVSPIPQISLKIIRMMRDDQFHLQDIANEIRQDQVISAKVIRFCNSAFFGLKTRIDSIDRALVMLGEKQFLQLVISASMETLFPETSQGYSLCKGGLYKHTLGTALIAEKLSNLTGSVPSDKAYTAGLLHDIGKVVLDQYIAAAYPYFYRRTQEDGADLIAIEEEVFGLSHAEVGGQLAERWHLPEGLTDTIRCHHDPERATVDSGLTHLIYLANLLMSRFLVGQELERQNSDKLAARLQQVGLRPEQLPFIVGSIPRQLFHPV